MNDPLKKFVKQHREAFDHLEPPTGVFQRLQTQLQAEPARSAPATKHRILWQHRRTAWLVAASLLIGLVCAYLLFDGGRIQPHSEPQIVHQPVERAPLTAETPVTAQA